MTELEKAQRSLQEAAKTFDKSPTPDVARPDLLLRRAAIEYVRELLCSMLGYTYADLDLDELLNIADETLEAPGGARDPRFAARLTRFDELAVKARLARTLPGGQG